MSALIRHDHTVCWSCAGRGAVPGAYHARSRPTLALRRFVCAGDFSSDHSTTRSIQAHPPRREAGKNRKAKPLAAEARFATGRETR